MIATVAAGQTPPDQDADGFADGADNCVFTANEDQLDVDDDDVGDACDRCLASTVDVPGAPEGSKPHTDPKGCTVTQRCPCVGPAARVWPSRGAYLRCIGRQSRRLRRFRVLDTRERRRLLETARTSRCGFAHGRAGDMDGDGIPDDGDASGVAGDAKCHGDARSACDDNCMRKRNPKQKDRDDDGRGDVCDGEIDGDGVANRVDNCPFKSNEDQKDGDEDGVGDACDKCQDSEEDADVDRKGCD